MSQAGNFGRLESFKVIGFFESHLKLLATLIYRYGGKCEDVKYLYFHKKILWEVFTYISTQKYCRIDQTTHTTYLDFSRHIY